MMRILDDSSEVPFQWLPLSLKQDFMIYTSLYLLYMADPMDLHLPHFNYCNQLLVHNSDFV